MKNSKPFEPTIDHALVVCVVLKIRPSEIAPLGFDMDDLWTDPTIIEYVEVALARYAEVCHCSAGDSVSANQFRHRIRWCQRLMIGYEPLPAKDTLGHYRLPVSLGTGVYAFHDVMEIGE